MLHFSFDIVYIKYYFYLKLAMIEHFFAVFVILSNVGRIRLG